MLQFSRLDDLQNLVLSARTIYTNEGKCTNSISSYFYPKENTSEPASRFDRLYPLKRKRGRGEGGGGIPTLLSQVVYCAITAAASSRT